MYIEFGVTSSGKCLQWGCVSVGWLEYLYLRGRSNRRLQNVYIHIYITTYTLPLQQYYTKWSISVWNSSHCRYVDAEGDWQKHVRTEQREYGHIFVIIADVDGLMCNEWIKLFFKIFLKYPHLRFGDIKDISERSDTLQACKEIENSIFMGPCVVNQIE